MFLPLLPVHLDLSYRIIAYIDVLVFPLCFLWAVLQFEASGLYLWSILSWFLCMLKDRSIFFLNINIDLPRIMYWRNCLLCMVCFWCVSQESITDRYIDLFLSFFNWFFFFYTVNYASTFPVPKYLNILVSFKSLEKVCHEGFEYWLN